MAIDTAAGIVRILGPDGSTSGAGFVVSESGLIATCSHVIQSQALQTRGEAKPDKVTVVFNATGDKREARVQPDWWRDAVKEDVAILQLEGDLPPGIQPLPLGSSGGTSGHGFKTYGFPDARSEEGLWGYGAIGDPLQVEGGRSLLQLTGTTEVSPGFSGAPVLDTLKRRIVGMVTAITAPDQFGRLVETAFITTTETLRAVCPVLQLSDICPYLGLSFFKEMDAEFFFGRQQVVDRLLDSLRREPRFLAVLGPSGCGKSSVIRARLIPELRLGTIPGSGRWGIIVARTADQPIEQLLVKGLEADSTDLLDAVKKWQEANPDKTRLALILDQFEETLVSCPDRLCQSFVLQLSRLLDSPMPVTLIIVMRDEFYSRFVKRAPSLLPWLERSLVNVPSTLGRDELAVIVREPARVVGLEFEPGLVEDCVNDVLKIAPGVRERIGQSTALPLLEFALAQLWEKRDESLLTHEAYKFIGGVTGCLTQWADRAYSSLNKEQRPLSRCILMGLVHLGNESQGVPDSKRQRPLADLCGKEKDREAVRKVVEKLAGERLLVTSFEKQSGQEIVDIIHDALIREWGLFQQWLNADRRFLLWSQELDESARAWVATDPNKPDRRDEGRLMRGRVLDTAEGWLKERGSDLSLEQREYIHASLNLRAREQAEVARKQAEIERLRKRNTKILAAGLVVALIFSSIAFYQWRQADRQKTIALAKGLTASATLLKDGSNTLPLGVLLAIESLRLSPTSGAEGVINQGLALLPRSISNITHNGQVNSVSFSPDGRYIATTSDDKTAALWNATTGFEAVRMIHYGRVIAGAFSPDGRYFATGSDDNTSRLWETSTGKEIAIMRHNGSVNSIVFSPDGKLLATASSDGTTGLWSVPGGRQLALMAHDDKVWAVEFSPDGKYLATGSKDGTARIWEIPSGREMVAVNHSDNVNSVAFSPDGRYLATGSDDGTARIWNVASGYEIRQFLHKGPVNFVSFSPDGAYLATASNDQYARVWDIATGIEESRVLHGWSVIKVVFSPDGKYIATASLDGTARIATVHSGLEVLRMSHDDSVYDAAFSPDGRYLVTASRDNTSRVWAAVDDREVAQIAHDGPIGKVLFSPSGSYLATASDDGTARLWDIPCGREEARLDHGGPVNDACFSSKGDLLATASDDAFARLWDIPGGRLAAKMSHDDKVWSVVFSPDDRYILTGSEDDTARLWSVPDSRMIASINHSGPVHSVAFSPDGKFLAIGSDDGSASIWLVEGVRQMAVLRHGGYLNAVAFSPDGKYLATASEDANARLWEVPGGKLTKTMPHDKEVTDLAFSPNGTYLATASVDSTVKQWEIPSGKEVELLKHDDQVWNLAYSPDGKYLATVSNDKTARVWRVPEGIEIARIPYTDFVTTVAFSPDGRYLATASIDSTARVWLWNPGDPIAEACSRLTRNPTCGEWRRYLPGEPYSKICPNLPAESCG